MCSKTKMKWRYHHMTLPCTTVWQYLCRMHSYGGGRNELFLFASNKLNRRCNVLSSVWSKTLWKISHKSAIIFHGTSHFINKPKKTPNNDEISKISNSSRNFSHSLSHLTAFPIILSPLAGWCCTVWCLIHILFERDIICSN